MKTSWTTYPRSHLLQHTPMSRIFINLLFILTAWHTNGQVDSIHRWRISTEYLQLCFVNVNVNLERVVRYGSHGLVLAYRPSLRSGGEVRGSFGLFGDYGTQNAWNWIHQSFTIGSTHRMDLEKGRSFLQFDAIYRRWWLNNKWVSYPNVEGYGFDGSRTEVQDVMAVKAYYGRTAWLGRSGRNNRRYYVEMLTGLGWRWRTQRFTTHTGTVLEVERMNYNETFHQSTPSINLGMRLGFAWGQR